MKRAPNRDQVILAAEAMRRNALREGLRDVAEDHERRIQNLRNGGLALRTTVDWRGGVLETPFLGKRTAVNVGSTVNYDICAEALFGDQYDYSVSGAARGCVGIQASTGLLPVQEKFKGTDNGLVAILNPDRVQSILDKRPGWRQDTPRQSIERNREASWGAINSGLHVPAYLMPALGENTKSMDTMAVDGGGRIVSIGSCEVITPSRSTMREIESGKVPGVDQDTVMLVAFAANLALATATRGLKV